MQAKQFVTIAQASGVMPGMHVDGEAHVADAQARAAPQEPYDRGAVVVIGNQHDKISGYPLCHGGGNHPNTPAAYSTLRFGSPFQSLSAGCSGPRTMSAAPSPVLPKHSTCSGWAKERMTGECVASKTWAS